MFFWLTYGHTGRRPGSHMTSSTILPCLIPYNFVHSMTCNGRVAELLLLIITYHLCQAPNLAFSVNSTISLELNYSPNVHSTHHELYHELNLFLATASVLSKHCVYCCTDVYVGCPSLYKCRSGLGCCPLEDLLGLPTPGFSSDNPDMSSWFCTSTSKPCCIICSIVSSACLSSWAGSFSSWAWLLSFWSGVSV